MPQSSPRVLPGLAGLTIIWIAVIALDSRCNTSAADDAPQASRISSSYIEPFESVGSVDGKPLTLIYNQGATFTANGRRFITENGRDPLVKLFDTRTPHGGY